MTNETETNRTRMEAACELIVSESALDVGE